MFENFPYTDMHQLNLDWIIKIAKDFLDQYTHIQQLITDGEESIVNLKNESLEELEQKTTELQALLDSWYATHSQDIATQLANAIASLNAWYNEHTDYLDDILQQNVNTFDSHAEQKATQVIASIPDDYTALSNTVDGLVTDVKEGDTFRKLVSGYDWVSGKYLITDGQYIGQLGNNVDYSTSEPIKLLPNAYYKITKQTGTRWCVYDSNNDPIMASKESFEFIATENWNTLRVSTLTANIATFEINNTYAYYIEDITTAAAGYFNKIVPIQDWISGYYVWADDGTVWGNTNWSCTNFLAVVPNSVVFIDHSHYQGAVYNNNGAYISGFKGDTDHSIVIPSNGYFIRFSCPTTDIDNNCIKMNIRNFTKRTIDIIHPNAPYNIADGGYISAFSGAFDTNASFSYTDYIPVKPNTIYEVFPTSGHVAFYDEGFNYVGGNTDTNRVCKIFKTTGTTYYIRASFATTEKAYFKIKEDITEIHVYPQSTSPADYYADLNQAFLDSHILLLPIYIHGGVWDVSNLSSGYGLQAVSDVIGIGNPHIIANPQSYNDDFSVLNITGPINYPSIMGNIKIEGLILEGSNLRYCLHMEMGGNINIDPTKNGYVHTIKNCTFKGGANIRRDVGAGVGDNGFILFENCVFENTQGGSAAADQLAIHSGFDGQNAKTTAIVKNCLFVNGTVSYNEVGNYQYSGFKNVFIANDNSVTAAPMAAYTSYQQNQVYYWNNVVR